MKKWLGILTFIILSSFVLPLSGLASENKEEIEPISMDIDQEQKPGAEKTIYTIVDETLVEGDIVRVYTEGDSPTELWLTISVPEEIKDLTKEIKNDEKKLEKTIELLANLYVEKESWFNLNILAYQMDKNNYADEIVFDQTQNKKIAKNLRVILESIDEKGQGEKVVLENEAEYIDNDGMEIFYPYLAFDSLETSKEILSQKEKELSKLNFFDYYPLGIALLVIVIVLAVFIKKRKG